MHAVIQVPPDGVVDSRKCLRHSFAACTVHVTVCFSCQTVSALTSGHSRYSARPTPCCLHLAHFGQRTGCWRIFCHRHSQLSPSLPWDFVVTQILLQYKPSCILSQYEVCYSCTVERLVEPPLFFSSLIHALLESLLIYPCTML